MSFGDLLLIAILGFGGARLLSMIALPMLFSPDVQVDRATRIIILLALHSGALLGAVYIIAVRLRGLDWLDLGFLPTTWSWARRAVLTAVLVYPVATWLSIAVRKLLEIEASNPQLDLIAPKGAALGAMLGMLIMVGFLAPITEELVFRGILYRWLRNSWGIAASALISALCFAALHNMLALVPALTLLGVVLALLVERSGSLWPAILTHGLFNAITVILLYGTKALGVGPL